MSIQPELLFLDKQLEKHEEVILECSLEYSGEYGFLGITRQEKFQLLEQFSLRLVDAEQQDIELDYLCDSEKITIFKRKINALPLTSKTQSSSISRKDRQFLLELLEGFSEKSISYPERLRTLEILQTIDLDSMWNYM